MDKPHIRVYHKAMSGRKDRFYPLCKLSKLICLLIKRTPTKKADCLAQWQIDLLKKYGIETVLEDEPE